MKKKTLLLVITTVLLILTCAVGITYAWLTFNKEATIKYKVGSIDYVITEVDPQNKVLVPGESLSNFKIVNKSTFATDFRVTITIESTVTKDTVTDLKWTMGTSAETNQILIELTEGFTQEKDGFIYYDNVPAGADGAGTEIAGIFQSIKINPELVGNDAMGADITITYNFEAKQHDYMTWDQMGTIVTNYNL